MSGGSRRSSHWHVEAEPILILKYRLLPFLDGQEAVDFGPLEASLSMMRFKFRPLEKWTKLQAIHQKQRALNVAMPALDSSGLLPLSDGHVVLPCKLAQNGSDSHLERAQNSCRPEYWLRMMQGLP